MVNRLRLHLEGALGGEGRVGQATIGPACAHLGDVTRVSQFAETGSAWLLLSAIRRDGSVGAEQVAAWWEMENQAVRLCQELLSMFPGSALLERHGEYFRFQLDNVRLRPARQAREALTAPRAPTPTYFSAGRRSGRCSVAWRRSGRSSKCASTR